MAISRTHTWSAGEVLLASDQNAEFNNILTNAADLVSPFTKAISMGGFALNFDAANTIALTAATNGVSLTGGAFNTPQGADIVSAATINLDTATGNVVDITGSTGPITAVTLSQGRWRWARFTGTPTITNGASLVVEGGADFTAVAGQYVLFIGYAASVVRCIPYVTPAATQTLTNKTITAATIAGANTLSGTLDRVALATAVGKIIPGATSISLRNNADNADNILVSDAGIVTLRALIDASASGAGQIKFPATQNASANANTLDDYSEGTWTPADGSGAALTFTSVNGYYTKIGRQITASATLTYPTTANGSTALVSGLPFASANLTGNNAVGSAFISVVSPAGFGAVDVLPSSTTIEFRNPSGAGTFTNANLSTGIIRLTITYFTAT